MDAPGCDKCNCEQHEVEIDPDCRADIRSEAPLLVESANDFMNKDILREFLRRNRRQMRIIE
jgi:hypothetical protein